MKSSPVLPRTSKPSASQSGFTLMEIIIVIIILGSLAGLAINNYRNVMEDSYKRNAVINLYTVYAALEIALYKKNNPELFPGAANTTAEVNRILGLNIVDPNFRYTIFTSLNDNYTASAIKSQGTSYTCSTIYDGAWTKPSCPP